MSVVCVSSSTGRFILSRITCVYFFIIYSNFETILFLTFHIVNSIYQRDCRGLNFFYGFNLPKTGQVLTLTVTGLNSNLDRS